MSSELELTPVKRALLQIQTLRSRLEELERSKREPIAVVGLSLRFPGAPDEDAFWQLLSDGRDAIREIPADRWDAGSIYDPDVATPGKTHVVRGGFLDCVDEFDAEFFGVPPREAVAMDPQHRLLLEVAWEALENAAQAPDALVDSATGVFLGIGNSDYQRMLMADTGRIDAYTGIGGSTSIAAGRLSYLLGLRGPSMAVDTSCSSSLVAVHLACRSLRSRECRLALAGGVHLILTPEGTIALSKARMLSPDGRCKTFDESADGFVRSEGCGVLVLKRLDDAIADGDPIHAVIRGTAVNQDGRSGGLTVPSGPAQQAVIRAALADAGMEPLEVSFVEAHGTGTALGDPIELHSLTAAYCESRPDDRPLLVGSVKTNIGHLEAAAGIAGLMKAILALKHNRVPAHLNFRTLNPHITLEGAALRITAAACAWPEASPRHVAGVSSFGFCGTNAHVIVEEAPAREPVSSPEGGPAVLQLSARTPSALREMARRYTGFLEAHPSVDLADVCFTAATGRRVFEQQASWAVRTVDALRERLAEFAAGTPGEPWPDAKPVSIGRRIPLPTYPFERTRHWLEASDAGLWSRARDAARSRSQAIPPELDLSSYPRRWDRLRDLATAAMLAAFQQCEAEILNGCRQAPDDLIRQTGILPGYRRLLRRWLDHLVSEGYLSGDSENGYVFRESSAPPDLDGAILRAGHVFPDERAIFEYASTCARRLAGILTGKLSPLETLFPNGDLSLAERLYEHSALARYFNSVAASAAAAAVRSRPKGCRILEIGAGTGATTAAILPALPQHGVEYHFTDVSNAFLSQAARKFESCSYVRYGVLNIERDPSGQGYQPASFDVIVATNVLHATADIRQTLRNVRTLLAPGGLLVLCEATRYLEWFDITTALIEGWGRHLDEVRGDHPLLSASQWKEQLSAAGFAPVQAFPEEGAEAEILAQHVLLALAPAKPGIHAETSAPQIADRPLAAPRLEQVAAAERGPLLVEFVRERLAAVLGHSSPAALSTRQPLIDLGMDSLMALEFRAALERGLNMEGRLSSTLVFDCPNIEAVAAYLEREMTGAGAVRSDPVTVAPPSAEPLAIVGAACRLPGGVNDLDSFWELLASGTDAISEIPCDRWQIDEWYDPDPDKPGKMATRWGGFLEGIDQFDPQFFGISPREAEGMDPQQRLLLEVSWEALENAAQLPGQLAETRTGVFVGVANDEYSRLMSRDGRLSFLDSYFASGVARSVAAGRISYVLGLQGPNLSIDTACSSSLVAVHQACQSLRSGECRMALAGGVNVILAPETSVALSRARMMARDGRCKAFDDSADGFVRAEGCVILVLKRLSDATADGDRVLALIRGSAINQDGRTSGLTVPNGPAQEAVIRQALADARVRPEDIDYVEAHGTGTSLGDPIEAHALAAALGQGRSPDSLLHIGSVKANVGHLEAAAGATGLLKAVLALSHEEIPPQLHFRRWNRNIDLKGAPLSVPVDRIPWPRGARSRRAGISSFGFSGTNAHVVLEEAPLEAPATPAAGVQVLRLSARSRASLEELVRKYCEFLDRHPEVSLADLCFTANACRTQFLWYIDVRAGSVEELRQILDDAGRRKNFAFAERVERVAPSPAEEPRGRKLALPTSPFERQRYWRPDAPPDNEHPLLGHRLSSPALSQTVFEAATRKWPKYLQDHKVQGKGILPMSAFVEILLAASGTTALEEILVQEPLELSGKPVQVVVGAERLDLFALAGDGWRLHASARPVKAGQCPPTVSITGIRSRMTRDIELESHYAQLCLHGAELGPAFRLVESLSAGAGEALGKLRIPRGAEAYRLHPALLDACFQVLNATVESADGLYVPMGLDRFELFEPPSDEAWSFASVRQMSGDILVADLRILDGMGRTLASAEGLRLKRAAVRERECALQEIAWRTKPANDTDLANIEGCWALFGDEEGTSAGLASALEHVGAICRIITEESSLESLLSKEDLRGMVYLRPLEARAQSASDLCQPLLQVARGLSQRTNGAPPQIFIVTRGAQATTDGDTTSPLQAMLWGVARSLRLEHPDLRCVTLDLGPCDDGAVSRIVEEIRAADGESQVARRGTDRLVARLAPAGGNCVRIEQQAPGTLDGLKPVLVSRRRPGPGEVEIAVAAAGLNFRDVLTALDLYPGEAGPLGAECAGWITAVGENVDRFAVGEGVVAIARGSMGSHVTADASLVAPKPGNVTMEEAATIPVAYVTARYALSHVGRLLPGERVLIHAGAGGVGLAAVAEAIRAGAVVFATAGSETKRSYLRSIGVHHVMNSRTVEFGREVLEITGGEGVDVVLNSLTGEFIPENLRILARGGRYLEIGKRGIWEASRVRELRPDVQFFVLDWGEQFRLDPEPIVQIYRELIRDVGAGVVRPLPFRRFALSSAVDAFREMSHAGHIGKIVLTPSLVRGDGRYLITGGLRGLGLSVAEWLVERGASDLVLVGRTAPDDAAAKTIQGMEQRGVRIMAARTDVSRAEEMQSLFAQMVRSGVPLKGVIHAAGVLEDGVLAQAGWDRFNRVLAPKVEGARLLEELTAGMDLDFFVMFSSLASVLGSPGQANHAAANCYLDAVALRRRSEGLPAISIDWGPWSTIGTAAGEKASRHLAGRGIGSMSPRQGIETLELALAVNRPQISAAVADWNEIQAALRIDPVYLSELAAPAPMRREPSRVEAELTALLDRIDSGDRREALIREVRQRACAVLGLDRAHPLDADRPLSDFGLDSLMAIELRNALASALGKPLPSTLIFSYPSIAALAGFLMTQVAETEKKAAGRHAQGEDDFLARIERLSDSEVDRLLHETAERAI